MCEKPVHIEPREWSVIHNIPYSLRISEIAGKAELPYSTTYKILEALRQRGKISFIPSYWSMGLLPIAVIVRGDLSSRKPPPYTLSVRRLFGHHRYTLFTAVVPREMVDRYLRSLEGDRVALVRGFELAMWLPSSRLTLYSADFGTMIPAYSYIYGELLENTRPVRMPKFGGEKLDWLDVAIIVKKMDYAFTKLTEVKAFLEKSYGVKVSKQVLSYHFKNHVVRHWVHNTVSLYLDMRLVPFRIFMLEGPAAPAVARTLTKIPYFYTAYIDVDKAIVVGQPPCSMHEELYEMLSSVDVEMPLGDLVMSSRNIVKMYGTLLNNFENGKWIWPDVEEFTVVRDGG